MKITRNNYDMELRKIKELHDFLVSFDFDEKYLAVVLWMAKRKLCKKYKGLKSAVLLERVFHKNSQVFGHKFGPDVKWLKANGKTYDDIIRMAISTTADSDVLSDRFKCLS